MLICYLEKEFDLEYAVIFLLCNSRHGIQTSNNQVLITVCEYSMHFSSLKYMVLQQVSQESVSVSAFYNESLEVVEKFVSLSICMNTDDGVTDVISVLILKARASHINRWHYSDASSAVKREVYSALM